mmetsp:Transcript_20502/g.34304  ORF Transcript_20502/g.34304 Transcript_20502/m.34304 type:complete len:206 (+) Transcript_20502:85-702(+)
MTTDQGWSTWPYWMSLRVSQMHCATGPADSPVGRRISAPSYTILRTGLTTTAVPAPKASSNLPSFSASTTSLMVSHRSLTSIPLVGTLLLLVLLVLLTLLLLLLLLLSLSLSFLTLLLLLLLLLLYHSRANARILSRVTPANMSPRVKGAVTSSMAPPSLSRFFSTKKIFIAPTSVIWWSSPYNQSTWLEPCFSLACFEGRIVGP